MNSAKDTTDIYNSLNWLNGVPKESSDYVRKILLGSDQKFNKEFNRTVNKNIDKPYIKEYKVNQM